MRAHQLLGEPDLGRYQVGTEKLLLMLRFPAKSLTTGKAGREVISPGDTLLEQPPGNAAACQFAPA